MTPPTSDEAPRRLAPLDGLRGAAIVLVVLSHGWALWPTEGLGTGPVANAFRSGDLAVSVFFVVGGYLLVRSLLRETDRVGTVHARRAVLRRYVRLSAHVYTLAVAMLVVHAVDDSDTYSNSSMRQSILHIATYTWNWFARSNALLARPDLGHLWFVSVYLQVAIGLIVLVKLLGRHRVVLAIMLAVGIVAVTAWRAHALAHEGEYSVLLRTSTRMDPMLWGALAAVAQPRLKRLVPPTAARFVVGASVVALIVLVLTVGGGTAYLGPAGVLINGAAATFVAGIATLPRHDRVPLLAAPRLVALGTMSMAIFVWHYPIFWAVARHTTTWTWPARTVVALAITAAAVTLVQRAVEHPLQARLARGAEAHPRTDEPAGSPRADA